MLFATNSTGLEINPQGAVFATIAGSAAAPRLERVASATFPENTLHISLREQNVLEPEIFVDRIRSAHNLLLSRSAKVSVTLPDSVGRILLLDLEGRFKSRAEALDLIRWKLKKSIPFDLADTHLDYQKLAVRENGDMSLLVALVSKTVISQYEELLLQDHSEGPQAGQVAMARIRVGGLEIMLNDSPPVHAFTFTPSSSIFIDCDDEAQLRALAAKLGDGGKVMMPIDTYGFSALFTWVGDRFGVSWQLNLPAA